jgi:hypothetical protein
MRFGLALLGGIWSLLASGCSRTVSLEVDAAAESGVDSGIDTALDAGGESLCPSPSTIPDAVTFTCDAEPPSDAGCRGLPSLGPLQDAAPVDASFPERCQVLMPFAYPWFPCTPAFAVCQHGEWINPI